MEVSNSLASAKARPGAKVKASSSGARAGPAGGKANGVSLFGLMPPCLMYYLGDFLDTETTLGLYVAFNQIKKMFGADECSRLDYHCQILDEFVEKKIKSLNYADTLAMIVNMARFSENDMEEICISRMYDIVRPHINILAPLLLTDYTHYQTVKGSIRSSKKNLQLYGQVRENPPLYTKLNMCVTNYVRAHPMQYPAVTGLTDHTILFYERGGAGRVCVNRLEWYFKRFIVGLDDAPVGNCCVKPALNFINMCAKAYKNQSVADRQELISTWFRILSYNTEQHYIKRRVRLDYKKQNAIHKILITERILVWMFEFIFDKNMAKYLQTVENIHTITRPQLESMKRFMARCCQAHK